jgi:VanZ family protein
MSTLPIGFTSLPMKLSPAIRTPGARKHWLPVVCALIFICFTSTTFMGGNNTGAVVSAVWKAFFGTGHMAIAAEINLVGRKVGHFLGYGIIGLIFRNAWYKSARVFSWVTKTWLTPFAAVLAVASTLAVGSLDEYHQIFLPGRVGCVHDALLDTSGAIFLNVVFWTVTTYQQRKKDRRTDLTAGTVAV